MAGYIAPADPAQRGDLPLGEGGPPPQAVAQTDDVGLPPGEAGVHALADLGTGVPQVQFLQHVVVYPHHVYEGQGTVFVLAIQRIRQR